MDGDITHMIADFEVNKKNFNFDYMHARFKNMAMKYFDLSGLL